MLPVICRWGAVFEPGDQVLVGPKGDPVQGDQSQPAHDDRHQVDLKRPRHTRSLCNAALVAEKAIDGFTEGSPRRFPAGRVGSMCPAISGYAAQRAW